MKRPRFSRCCGGCRAQGVAIVFVSHKLEEVLSLCDRVTVLRDGKIAAADEPIANVSRGRLVSLMIGRDERVADIGVRNTSTSETVLDLEGVSTSFGHRNIDLSLRKGEILGLYGLVGAGRTRARAQHPWLRPHHRRRNPESMDSGRTCVRCTRRLRAIASAM